MSLFGEFILASFDHKSKEKLIKSVPSWYKHKFECVINVRGSDAWSKLDR